MDETPEASGRTRRAGADPIHARSVSRRGFIKGVIASGATAYGASYLFRQAGTAGAQPAAGAAERLSPSRSTASRAASTCCPTSSSR